ncbi:HpcH/HpaI aldolase/citrate lyase family protein [Verminephrobacter eiseniae]|uniref:Citryl-CoA lyase n=1 Tax=Verminephrobacter eiseniae (strain EF01-2) TaxID=391735 RepID=A1WI82_VEREI|nr:CoA ester lyase [Verminephrobacter eiseniae]ABM57339.1 Citryl-CoA lyase [Verminephrobacter eiseniae EF01-2]MCW5262522.1 CoA ester lyase [Verminephrobacter eiseniae]MCW5282967.1 CoA ester lyase [Verminephrobacter eiseniae]MCW5303282.1 CoA ester lyase [Verminephrobacter eiseniae]MCW8178131.1 CoA ester lyase [Verminephrobacter eiseniae]
MQNRTRRLRRCQLSVPGSSEKMMRKASETGVDFVFLDLEDAVAPSEKRAARAKIVSALNTLDWGKTTRCVRINDLTTQYAYEDIIEVVEGARENLDMLMLPKAMSAADVQFVDKLLSMMEKKLGLKKRIGIDVLIEEVEAMMRVEEIAASTPRLECLIFGMGDYSASQGVSIGDIGGPGGYPGDIWSYQRHKLTIAARANRIDAVDGPYADFKNPDAFREECRRAMILGMVGKWAIHPSQVAIAQEVFSPPAQEVARAREMIEAYDAALAQGLGAVQYGGKMIDIASVRIVRNLVDRADQIGI